MSDTIRSAIDTIRSKFAHAKLVTRYRRLQAREKDIAEKKSAVRDRIVELLQAGEIVADESTYAMIQVANQTSYNVRDIIDVIDALPVTDRPDIATLLKASTANVRKLPEHLESAIGRINVPIEKLVLKTHNPTRTPR